MSEQHNEHEHDDNTQALREGLAELRERGPSGIYAARGTTTKNLELRLSATDAALLNLMRTMAHLVVGRPVSKAVIVRRSIGLLADHLASTLRDPVKATEERMAFRQVQRGGGEG